MDPFVPQTAGDLQEDLDANLVEQVVWHGFAGSWKGDW